MRQAKSIWIALVVAVLLGLSLVVVYGQNKGDKDATAKTVTATGCLAKGDSPGEFYLTGEDGTAYELRSDSVPLADHLGHKVTVKGTVTKEVETGDDDDDKDEARESKMVSVQVTDLKMVSNRCN